jgi:hypothetical protein
LEISSLAFPFKGPDADLAKITLAAADQELNR